MSDEFKYPEVKLYTFKGAAGCYVYEGDYRASLAPYQTEIERLTRKCSNADLALKVQTENCDQLKARVAELEGLLSLVIKSGVLAFEDGEPEDLGSLEADICAALSKPAYKHGEPNCKTCFDQGELFVRKGDVTPLMETEPEPVMRACPDCAPPTDQQGEAVAMVMEGDPDSQNTEFLMLCKGQSMPKVGTKLYVGPGYSSSWYCESCAVEMASRRPCDLCSAEPS